MNIFLTFFTIFFVLISFFVFINFTLNILNNSFVEKNILGESKTSIFDKLFKL
jgi:hypothetical protein